MKDRQYNKSIAVMGGTFDPIHLGHLAVAQTVFEEFSPQKIIFIPSGIPPHKEGVSNKEDRYNMTVLATLNNYFFDVSRMEIDRKGTTYTIDSILELKNEYGQDTKIFFIIGLDIIKDIFYWKNYEQLIKLCEFIVVPRPNINEDEIKEMINKFSKTEIKFTFLEANKLEISSTDIRNKIANNKSIKYLTTPEVESYIIKNRLYKNNKFINIDIDEIDKFIKSELSSYRYTHSIGVAETASMLAERFGDSKEKAYIAGLLHDCAKEKKYEEKLSLCEEYKIDLDPIMRSNPDLSHGLIAAEIAKKNFDIYDENILNAIRYHTTGRKHMTTLEKIVFLADIIEINRGDNPFLKELRDIAIYNLNAGVLLGLKKSMDLCIEKNIIFHPMGLEALNSLESNM